MSSAKALPVITTERLVLRLPAREDAVRMAEYVSRNREAFRATEPPRPAEYYTEAFWLAQADRSVEEFVRDAGVRFVLFAREGGARVVGQRPIGTVGFNQIVRGPYQGCTLGYALDPAEQGKGLMHEALTALIRYMFEERNLHRITAGYMPANVKSGAVLRCLGFVIEGEARDYILIDGQWRDHVLTSLVNPAWSLSRAALPPK
jgi:ribosomal-protein-alanine N-acetyltransferase